MTLKEWRQSKGWTQNYLAMVLTKKSGEAVSQQNVHVWESGSVPNAIIGEAVRQLSGGRVVFTKAPAQ